MGAVVRDFDGDQHLDWFVMAIFLPDDPYLANGNRLMLGAGSGQLWDVSHESGVRDGG